MLLGVGLFAVCAVVAAAVARRDRRHLPIALYCGVVAALDVFRLVRAAVLSPATGPREGWELLIRHLDCGAYLATLLALPAMAQTVFAKRIQKKTNDDASLAPEFPRGLFGTAKYMNINGYLRAGFSPRGGILLAGLLLWLIVITDYPVMSGPGLLEVYRLVELGGVLVAGLCFAQWLASPRLFIEGLSAPVISTLAFITASATAVAIPRFAGGTLLDSWNVVLWVNVAMGSAVLLVESGELCRRGAPA